MEGNNVKRENVALCCAAGRENKEENCVKRVKTEKLQFSLKRSQQRLIFMARFKDCRAPVKSLIDFLYQCRFLLVTVVQRQTLVWQADNGKSI